MYNRSVPKEKIKIILTMKNLLFSPLWGPIREGGLERRIQNVLTNVDDAETL